jgi:phosphatidylinositol glycan class M
VNHPELREDKKFRTRSRALVVTPNHDLITMRTRVNFTHILTASIAIRIALICYSEWYDAQPETVVKYTDIDYRVFTDAARYVVRERVQGVNDALGYRDVGNSTAKGPLGSWLGVGE